jgi:two-component system, LytTR family, response regulator
MKAIIIEDEPLVAKDLQKLLSQLLPNVEILCILDSVKSSVHYFTSHPEPDLLFMDIQLSDGVSLDIFKQITLKCPIIFTTAYDEYAIRAFKVNSIDYLLKPVDKNELKHALEKYTAIGTPPEEAIQNQLENFLKQITIQTNNPIYKERFTAHYGKSFLVIDQHKIAYFQKENLIYITTTDKQQYITDFQTMEEIDELLNPKFFFRANRQFIIHLHAVESYRADSYGKLAVKLKAPINLTIDISREKAQSFKQWLG